jgi:SAM-dependent MidA family methyltransferase
MGRHWETIQIELQTIGRNHGVYANVDASGDTKPSLTMTHTMRSDESSLPALIARRIHDAGGWIGFDDFMALALYAPGLGYYASRSSMLGSMPGTKDKAGSDFVTAPELSPLFGRALARQVAEALHATQTDEIWEFGAGSGALALQVLDTLQAMGISIRRYIIVDVSPALIARQQVTLQAYPGVVHWSSSLPDAFSGVVLGNEVLDAMPVKLLARVGTGWHERGVVVQTAIDASSFSFAWKDQPTDLRPPYEVEGEHDYLTELQLQGEAFIRTLADRLGKGAIFLLDYGFPEAEYFHPQRHMGTVMCHRDHVADGNPLEAAGQKDITAHVNFTGIAAAAQEAGLEILGYTSQAHFLLNCGLENDLQHADVRQSAAAQKLVLEHEMGELFKVIGLTKRLDIAPIWSAVGFSRGDRTHRL